MIDLSQFFQGLVNTPLQPWCNSLPAALEAKFSSSCHGLWTQWQQLLNTMPRHSVTATDFNSEAVRLISNTPLSVAETDTLKKILLELKPWRKGPFQWFDVYVDTEWRSDWKWQRLLPGLESLYQRRVLDVGCGNGYYALRMLGAGAAYVVGLEPMLLYHAQFLAFTHFAPKLPIHLLPLTLEELPEPLPVFDTVFSMGVLYHQRSPLDHILALKNCLRPGGQLVLETLVVTDALQEAFLMPEARYAKMRNVWFIPGVNTLALWLRRCGFSEVRLIDVTVTTEQEQRATEWMTFESLADFLDPTDKTKTIEGYPAPCRAICVATKT